MDTEEIAQTTEETVENVNLFIQYAQDHIPDLIGFGIKIILAVIVFVIG